MIQKNNKVRFIQLIICSTVMLICSLLLLHPIDVMAAPLDAPNGQGTAPVPPTITVLKKVLPANDPGRFNLLINGNTVAANIGDGGSSGGILVNSGQYNVSETAVPGTSLTNYDTIIQCVNQVNQPIASSSGSSSIAVQVVMNQQITCTITNVRKDALVLTQTGSVSSVEPGETIAYSLNYINTGAATLTDLIISETVPENSTFEPTASTTGWACQPDESSGSICTFEVGTLPAGATNSVPLLFGVTIDSPIDAVNVSAIDAVARINDDTGQHVAIAVNSTPLIGSPVLVAQKQDLLLNDVDSNGVSSPGDTLAYQITLENRGNAPISSIVLNDSPDQSTTLFNGSITTSSGSVLAGNSAGDADVMVDVGTIAAGDRVVIDYQVTINASLPITITQLQNQAFVTSNELPAISTDDPDTLTLNDPTITSLLFTPNIVASQSDSLAVDRDGDGNSSPGDTILIEAVVSNTGNGTATNVFYTTPLDPNVQIVPGSVSTTLGSTTSGNGVGDDQVDVSIGLLPPGGSITIQFEVIINNPLPASVTEIQIQGIISSDQLADVLTDDLALPASQDPTSITVSAIAAMSITKRDLLFIDTDDDNLASAGDILFYRVEIVNNGNAGSVNLQLEDSPSTYTRLIPGSVQSSSGTVLEGNANEDSSIKVMLGSVAGRGSAIVVTYQVEINSVIPVSAIETQAKLIVLNTTPPEIVAYSDDPDTPSSGDVTVTFVRLTPGITSLYLPIIQGSQAALR